MIIDFNKIPEERKPGFKGGKGELCAKMYADELNKIMYDRLEPGSSIGYHVHETNSEIIIFWQARRILSMTMEQKPWKRENAITARRDMVIQ